MPLQAGLSTNRPCSRSARFRHSLQGSRSIHNESNGPIFFLLPFPNAFYLRRHHCVGRGSQRVVILLERRRGNGLSAHREHERGLPALGRPHRQPLERSVYRLVHGSDWTRSLPRLLMRQIHDVRLFHRSVNLRVGAARSRSNSLFFPSPFLLPRLAVFPLFFPLFLLSPSSSAHRLAPVPKCGGMMELRKESGAERLRCVALLSRRATPSQWLGEEVKAPATLASQRPRLFGAVAVSVAGMRVAFSPFPSPPLV